MLVDLHVSTWMPEKYEAGLMPLFEALRIAHSGKEGKRMTATVGWPLLLAVFLVPDAQLEAEAQVKRLEELRSGMDVWLSTALPASC